MNDTERAHWRYRVEALRRNQIKHANTEARVRQVASACRTLPLIRGGERNHWDDDADAIALEYKCETWLLAEAEYMCHLADMQADANATVLQVIRESYADYRAALANRQHGGAAADKFLRKVEGAIGA